MLDKLKRALRIQFFVHVIVGLAVIVRLALVPDMVRVDLEIDWPLVLRDHINCRRNTAVKSDHNRRWQRIATREHGGPRIGELDSRKLASSRSAGNVL